jgi:tetratricopeptide (TPR) repeat protein
MSLQELQTYLALLSATLSIASLGFILNLVKQVRENAQDRLAAQKDRMEAVQEDLKRTEKWHEIEKQKLNERLKELTSDMEKLLEGEGITLHELALGKRLSEAATEVRDLAKNLTIEMGKKLDQLANLESTQDQPNKKWQLAAAMGAMASENYREAASRFDVVAGQGASSWETHFNRGVAHANRRAGSSSNLDALRSYNEAIALSPADLDADTRSRLFCYRGAMLKRLRRLEEAEADLKLALSFAKEPAFYLDAHYNLAGVFAMAGNRDEMLHELSSLKTSRRYKDLVLKNRKSYFAKFSDDPEFLKLVE